MQDFARSFILAVLYAMAFSCVISGCESSNDAVSQSYPKADYYVSASTGDDKNTGTVNDPLRTIQKALDIAGPGEKILVTKGVYHERIFFPKSGEKDKPIILEGENGAVIHGGQIVKNWMLIDDKTAYPNEKPLIGHGIYKALIKNDGSSPTGCDIYQPYNLTWDDKYILRIREKLMGMPTDVYAGNLFETDDKTLLDVANVDESKLSPQDVNSQMLDIGSGYARLKAPSSSVAWDGVEALFAFRHNYCGITTPTYLRTRNKDDPNLHEISVCSLSSPASVNLAAKEHIVVRGFEIKGCIAGVYISEKSANNLIENNIVYGGKYGIQIKTGSSNNIIRGNELTLNYIADLSPYNSSWQNSGWGTLPEDEAKIWWHLWRWNNFKKLSDTERNAITLLNAGDNNEIDGNIIHDYYGGIQDWAFSDGNSTGPLSEYSKGLNVHDNVLYNILDDALEPSGGEIEAEWHDNIIYKASTGIRLKMAETGVGPIYIYKNKVACDGSDIFWFRTSAAKIFIYHNSFAGYHGNSKDDQAYPNAIVVNNIFSNNRFKSGNMGEEVTFLYNWLGGEFAKNSKWNMNSLPSNINHTNIVEEEALMWSTGKPFIYDSDYPIDFILSKESKASQSGLDLSKNWSAKGVSYPPLPGITEGYYLNGKPHMGAEPAAKQPVAH